MKNNEINVKKENFPYFFLRILVEYFLDQTI